MTEDKNFSTTPDNVVLPRNLVRQLFDLKSYNHPCDKNNNSPFDKLNNTDNLNAGIVFYKNSKKTVDFTNEIHEDIKQNNLILTNKELIDYQKESKITLMIMDKDKTNYSFVKADELIKAINGENSKIDINNLDIDDIKNVLSTLSELINTKASGKDMVKDKKYLSRICMTGVIPVFHEWKENRKDGHKLLSKKREQYVITYPAWPNFENCRKKELKGLSDDQKKAKNEEKLRKQWEILGVDVKLEPNPYDITERKKEYYKRYIKQIIELQIQAIQFDGKNQLSITFPSAFLKGFGQKEQDILIGVFGEAVKNVAKNYKNIHFFVSNAPNNFKLTEDEERYIHNVTGLDAAELNRSKTAKTVIKKEKIDIAYNVTPHDLTEVGNGCFGDGAGRAGDEAFARMAPMVIGVMGCSRNRYLQEIGLLAEKTVAKLNTKYLEEEILKKEKYIEENKDKTLLEVLGDSVNYYKMKISKLKSVRNSITMKNPNNYIDNINNLINGTEVVPNLDSILTIMIEKTLNKNINIINNKKFRETVLPEIIIDSENKIPAGFGGKISFDMKNKKAILNFLDNGFLMNKLDMIDGIPEIQNIKNILKNGINIDIKNIKENELAVIFGKFKTNPAIGFMDLLNNPNIKLTTVDGKAIEKNDKISEQLSTCLTIATESRKQIVKVNKIKEEIKTNNPTIAKYAEVISKITIKSLTNKEFEQKLIGKEKFFKNTDTLAKQVIILLNDIKDNKIDLSKYNINNLLDDNPDKQINAFLYCINTHLSEQLKKVNNNVEKIKRVDGSTKIL